MTDRAALVELALRAADRLDAGGQSVVAGLVRRLAREIVAPSAAPDTCACGCGTPLTHPRVGRRRRWAGESHRSRARRR